jgi:membrane-associated phospholipid phosphatase
MIATPANAVTDRVNSGRVCAACLLCLIVIAAPARAQERPPVDDPAEVGQAAELPTSALPGGGLNRLFGNRDESPGIFAVPRPRPLFVSPIESLVVTDDDAAAGASRRMPAVALQQPAEPPPQPAHTGFKALVFETGSDFKAFPRRRSTWVILAIGGASAAIAYPADDRLNARIVGSDAVARFFAPGKYIGAAYVQVGAAAGLYLIGRYMLPHADGGPKTNKVSHLGFDLLRSLIVSQAVTHGIKLAVRRDRPTGECCAFPSGHSSATFATASVLERHLGYRGTWPTFVIAAYVATSRLHDNRHFLSDVLFGGAAGIATGWSVVGRHGRSRYAVMPVPVRGGAMLTFTRTSSPERHR